MKRAVGAIVLGCAMAAALAAPTPASGMDVAPASAGPGRSPPVLAYYYIWFDHSSWNRAKKDRSDLGPYSSDDAAVMDQQVRWAQQAGIGGFLVSWKHTPTLDRRLRQLVDIATRRHFGLGIVYQGLDFHRGPLPAEQVATDLGYFSATFAHRAPFRLFAKPLVVWSGTWQFTAEDIARVTAGLRSRLAILASERTIAGYARVADSVDGDAYYWSSVNPSTFPGYVEKLTDLGSAVHAAGRVVDPVGRPGFDARAIGGSSVVARAGEHTLLREIDAATSSSPDALGLISWNEFTENTHIEPSIRYGWTALNAVGVRLGTGPVGSTGDHGTGRAIATSAAVRSRPTGATDGHAAASAGGAAWSSGLLVVAGFAMLFVGLIFATARRAHRAPALRAVVLADAGAGRTLRQAAPVHLQPVVGARRARRKPTPWHRLILAGVRGHRRSRRVR